MSYFVRFDPPVADYIEAIEGLSPAARTALANGVVDELGRDADKFLDRHPLGPESLHFRYDYLQPDADTLHVFDFVVDGNRMDVGVVTVKYVSHTAHRADDPD